MVTDNQINRDKLNQKSFTQLKPECPHYHVVRAHGITINTELVNKTNTALFIISLTYT